MLLLKIMHKEKNSKKKKQKIGHNMHKCYPNKLSTSASLNMAERSEAKSAKRSFGQIF